MIIRQVLKYGIILCLTLFHSCVLDFGNNDESKPIPGPTGEWGLREDVARQIIQDYFEIHIEPYFEDATIEDVWIERFYGTYYNIFDPYHAPYLIMNNAWIEKYGYGTVAVMMGSKFHEYDDNPWREEVVKLCSCLRKSCFSRIFHYNNGNRILIFIHYKKLLMWGCLGSWVLQ
jgi:hypothetical protein